ncbi:(4Fe-4S)-binding protein [Streptomyces sp. SM12]|uniref:(4Fe-4S)-binding protein n=1 Tax=Streptomyces sp. SM12 TaxID=1071602 RepID=UPI000CD58DE8|nr:(4Fe-4S)-binding protein [Streptomyces sp. SM12]
MSATERPGSAARNGAGAWADAAAGGSDDRTGSGGAPGAEAPGRSAVRAYRGRSITVTFEAGRCQHAAECVRRLPEVFDPAARPWIRPDGADVERVAEVVGRCPSGALRHARTPVDGDPAERRTRDPRTTDDKG